MITSQQLAMLKKFENCEIFTREAESPDKIHVHGYFYEAGPSPDAPSKTWREVQYIFGYLPIKDVGSIEALDDLGMEAKQGMKELTPEEAYESFITYANGNAPVPVPFTYENVLKMETGICCVRIPQERFPVLWIWNLDASLGAEYRKNGVEGLLAKLRDIKAEKDDEFGDEVHVDITASFSTLHDAEVFALGLAYAHSGETYGAPDDFLGQDADVFVTDPKDVALLTAFFAEEGLL